MRSEGDEVIFKVCGGSKIYDKNGSDLLARAINLKPQKLSYLNSWLVLVVVFMCLCVLFECVCVFIYMIVCFYLFEMTDALKI